MSELQATRINTGNRLELVSRRIEYLTGAIESLRAECEAFIEEQAILQKLQKLYANTDDDPIDVERMAISAKPKVKPHRPPAGSISDIVLDLLDSGPAFAKELASATGFSVKQVTNSCLRLRDQGALERIARGQYKKV